MSICRGIAGRRGKNPVGIFIHNDAGGNSLNAAYWANSLANGSQNKEKGQSVYTLKPRTSTHSTRIASTTSIYRHFWRIGNRATRAAG